MNHAFVDTAVVTAIQDDYRSQARVQATTRSQEKTTTGERVSFLRRVHRRGLALQETTRASARPVARVTEGVQPS